MNIAIVLARQRIRVAVTNVAIGLDLQVTACPQAHVVIADTSEVLEDVIHSGKHAVQLLWDPGLEPVIDLTYAHPDRCKIFRVIEDENYGGWTHMWEHIGAIQRRIEK